MNTSQNSSLPKRTYSVALLGKEGYSLRTLKDTTYFSEDIVPLIGEVRERFGPEKAAMLLKETIDWMRSIGLMDSIKEIEFVMEIVAALQEDRQLPQWVPDAPVGKPSYQQFFQQKIREAKADSSFQGFVSKILSSPHLGDDELEDASIINPVKPTPSPDAAASTPLDLPEEVGKSPETPQPDAFASITVQISGPAYHVKEALEFLVNTVDDEIEYLKADSTPLKFHVSQTLQTVQ